MPAHKGGNDVNLETIEMWDAMKDVKYRRTLEQLKEIIQNPDADQTAALTAALNIVASAVHAEAGTLWYYDRFGDGLIRPRAVYGGGEIFHITLVPGEGLAGQVIESGKAAIIADCQKDPRWAGRVDARTGFCTRSMICVPLLAAEQPFGCIQIINKTDGQPFDEKDLAFARKLAAAVSEVFALHGGMGDLPEEKEEDREFCLDKAMCAPNLREMEITLRGCGGFAYLGVSDQQAVLEHAREIWKILDRKRAHGDESGTETKRSRFGFFKR